MHLTEPGSAPRPDGEVRLVALSARPTLPTRVRSLLEGVLALAGGLLERSLALTLNEHEQQLFKLAEKAHSSNEQHAVFASLREVKRGRADVAPRFMLFLESALAQLDGKPAASATPPRRYQELALVETRDLEENIALQEISAKAEIRHSQALYALGHRFGVMAGAPALDAEHLPLGPQQICAALRYATACLGIALEHRLLLYRQFDRVALAEAGVLFNAVNDYLVEKRILPHLQLGPGRSAATPPPQNQTAAPVPPAEARAASAASATPAAVPRSAPAQRTAQPQPEDARDSELFHTLRELLAGRRQHQAPAAPAAANSLSSYVATGEDLQAVLGSLQARPAAPMILGGRVVQRNIAHLRQDLLNQLRQFTPDGRPPRLTEVDADTLDLVGMLFDFIAKDVRPTGATQSLLTKLQVPVLRVALRDKSFFTRRGHPARQLLNAIAETGQYWIDETEGEADRVLVEKMQLVVDRVSNEFDGRDELFDELLTDLSRHMGTLARKAEVSERRHVDAAKGRERLDIARERATQAVAVRLQDKKVNRLVRSLLEQAWTDVLALTILRQGEESEVYRRRLGVVEQLVAGQETASPALRYDIEQGLGQIGFHAEEAQEMLQQILGGGPPRDDSSATRTELALKLKSKTRLGEEPAAEATPVASAVSSPAATPAEAAPAPLNAEERQTLERLKTLPYGTWFEFVLNQQGDTVRRKLSWFSTLTGRCLFVNQRGARTEERTMQQLARDLVRKQVRIVSEERESLIDRAWHAIVGTLKTFAGKPPAAQTDAG